MQKKYRRTWKNNGRKGFVNQYIVINNEIENSDSELLYIHSGNILKVNKNGSTYDSTPEETGHYSRLRKYSSVRTLSEILGRVYSQDEAKSVLKRVGGGAQNIDIVENDNINITIKASDNTTTKERDQAYDYIVDMMRNDPSDLCDVVDEHNPGWCENNCENFNRVCLKKFFEHYKKEEG